MDIGRDIDDSGVGDGFLVRFYVNRHGNSHAKQFVGMNLMLLQQGSERWWEG